MAIEDKIKTLEQTKLDIIKQFGNICGHDGVDGMQSTKLLVQIRFIFDAIIEFYEAEKADDKTRKKAIVIKLLALCAREADKDDFPLNSFDSSIEYLFYAWLEYTMPQHVRQCAYLSVQRQPVEPYRVDIALIEAETKRIMHHIECKGFADHVGDQEKVVADMARERKIQYATAVPLTSYSGKDIYGRSADMSKEFWAYVVDKHYPYPKEESRTGPTQEELRAIYHLLGDMIEQTEQK